MIITIQGIWGIEKAPGKEDGGQNSLAQFEKEYKIKDAESAP